MDFLIVLTCEYLFNETECITYLDAIDIDETLYEYVYKPHDMNTNHSKKRIRKLCNVNESDLTEYSHLMSVDRQNYYDHNIKLPKSVRSLILNDHYKCNVSTFSHIIHLKLGRHLRCLPFILPDKLISLKLYVSCDTDLSKIPLTLKYLTIYDSYPNESDTLPSNITHLSFGWSYDKPLSKLPITLTHLSFGRSFNQELLNINTSLPELKYLRIGAKFEHPIIPPSKLTTLIWKTSYKLPELPKSLTYLSTNAKIHNNVILPALIRLIIRDSCELLELPSSLTYLAIHGCYDQNINIKTLPTELTHLIWTCHDILPELHSNIIYLTIKMNKHLLTLPSKLTHLSWNCMNYMNGTYLNMTKLILPDTLTHLTWSCRCRYPIMPNNLRVIHIGHNVSYSITNIPKNIRYIEVYERYKYIDVLQLLFPNRVRIKKLIY
jgi:hypothetical protein